MMATLEPGVPRPADDAVGCLLRTPYLEAFVAELKEALPREDRAWCPELEGWWTFPVHVLDVETTGPEPLEAELVQAAFLRVSMGGNALDGSWVKVVNPGRPIPAEAAAVHGITTARAEAEGVPLAEALHALVIRCNRVRELDLPLVIYNAPFDWTLLHASLARHGGRDLVDDIAIVDPLLLDRTFDKYRRGSRKLADVCAHYGVPLDGAHEAGADALGTAQLARVLVNRFPELRTLAPVALHARQVEWYREWQADFNAYQERRGTAIRSRETWPAILPVPAAGSGPAA